VSEGTVAVRRKTLQEILEKLQEIKEILRGKRVD